MHRGLFAIAVVLLAGYSAWGQNPPLANQAEQVRSLLERVERLEKRVAELEAKQPATTMVTDTMPGAAPSQKPEAEQAVPQPTLENSMKGHMDQNTVGQAETHYPALQIRGFADVDSQPRISLGRRAASILVSWTCT